MQDKHFRSGVFAIGTLTLIFTLALVFMPIATAANAANNGNGSNNNQNANNNSNGSDWRGFLNHMNYTNSQSTQTNSTNSASAMSNPDAIAASSAVTKLTGGDWLSFIFNSKDSRNQASSTINSINIASLKQVWVIKTGQFVTSTPVVSNGSVYFGDWGGNVYSANVSTGAIKWKVNVGGAVSSTPALSNGIVYVGFGPSNATVIALSQATGQTIWSTNLPGTMKAIWASPTLFNGLIYIGTASSDAQGESNASVQGKIYAINAATGNIVWSVTTSGTTGGAGVWSSVVFEPTSNSIYFGTGNSYTVSPNAGSVSSNDFRFYSSCSQGSPLPSYSNGDYLTPYPSNVPSGCSFDLNDIDQATSQDQQGFSFTGTFDVNGASTNPSDEETVMAVDDVMNWTGQGYGFRTSLSNNTIFAFAQDGTKLANGWTFYETVPLTLNDGLQHNFKVTVATVGTNNIISFYIDGALKTTIVRDSPANYSAQEYHLVMTTHRWENGWSSGSSALTVKNITILTPPATIKYAYSLVSLNSNTGKLNWFYQVYNSLTVGGDDDIGSTPNLFAVKIHGVVYQAAGIGDKNGDYYIVNRLNGALLETLKIAPSGGGIIGVPGYIYKSNNFSDPELFIPSYKNGAPDFTNPGICCGKLTAVIPSKGTIAWSFNASSKLGNVVGSVALVPGAVLFGDIRGNVYALSTSNGAVLWHTSVPVPIFGGVSVAEGHIFVPGAFSSTANALGVYAYST